ncbi:hypothetical protein ASD14_02180 [Lysobacter sp. Root494]|nr:hypothetical protein ASD14_02180 [Lysobacter sp. Root494]
MFKLVGVVLLFSFGGEFMKGMLFRYLSVVTLLVGLGGCASGLEYAEVPAPVVTDKATVVVYRVFSMQGAAWTHGVFVDGRHIANLRNDGFTRFLVRPGLHKVSVGTKSKLTRHAEPVEMAAGETYYFGEPPSMMPYAPIDFVRVEEDKAQKWLRGKKYQPPLIADVE